MIDVVVFGGIFREVLDGGTVPRRRLGGSGVTAAVLASAFGARTTLMSYVGEDDAAFLALLLEATEVDGSSVIALPGASGTFVFPTEGIAAGRPWPMYRPAEATPDAVPVVPRARVYVVFGVPDFDWAAAGWLSSLPVDAILIWDRQGWISRARDSYQVVTLAPAHKIYVANAGEACEEFPPPRGKELVDQLPPAGFEAAVVKVGVHGCLLVDAHGGKRGVLRIESFDVGAVSTIGSGDAFAGALAARLAAGASLSRAARVANAAAAAFLKSDADLLVPDLYQQAQKLLEQGSV